MQLFSMLKRNSRIALRGSWGRGMLTLLIPAAGSALLHILLQLCEMTLLPGPRQIPVIAALGQDAGNSPQEYWPKLLLLGIFLALSCLLLAPLGLGVTRWRFQLVHGKSLPLSEVFHFFREWTGYGRAVWYSVSIHLRSFFWAALCLGLPGGTLLLSLLYLQNNETKAAMSLGGIALVLSAALLLLGVILCMICLNRYALAPYLLCEENCAGVGLAMKTSVSYTRGYRLSFFLYGLSFLGWLLLSVATLGLGALFTGPYMGTANAMYSRYVMEKNRYIPQQATREFKV